MSTIKDHFLKLENSKYYKPSMPNCAIYYRIYQPAISDFLYKKNSSEYLYRFLHNFYRRIHYRFNNVFVIEGAEYDTQENLYKLLEAFIESNASSKLHTFASGNPNNTAIVIHKTVYDAMEIKKHKKDSHILNDIQKVYFGNRHRLYLYESHPSLKRFFYKKKKAKECYTDGKDITA